MWGWGEGGGREKIVQGKEGGGGRRRGEGLGEDPFLVRDTLETNARKFSICVAPSQQPQKR